MEEKDTEKDGWITTSTAEDAKKVASKQTIFNWDEDEYPPTWDFELNPICEGTVSKIGHIMIDKRKATFLNVVTEEGEFTVWAGKVIQDKIVVIPITPNDTIGIRYLGMVTGNSGFKYCDYAVRVRKPESGV